MTTCEPLIGAPRHHLLMTCYGSLDGLGIVGRASTITRCCRIRAAASSARLVSAYSTWIGGEIVGRPAHYSDRDDDQEFPRCGDGATPSAVAQRRFVDSRTTLASLWPRRRHVTEQANERGSQSFDKSTTFPCRSHRVRWRALARQESGRRRSRVRSPAVAASSRAVPFRAGHRSSRASPRRQSARRAAHRSATRQHSNRAAPTRPAGPSG